MKVKVWIILLIISILLVTLYCKFLIPNTYEGLKIVQVIDLIWIMWLCLGTVYGFVYYMFKFIKECIYE